MRLAIIIAMATVPGGFGQIAPEQMSGGALNCRFWNTNTAVQQGFLLGYSDAWSFVESDTKLKEAEYVPPGATYGEMRKGIDEVCAEPANARIPIHWALAVFSAKVNGTAEVRLKEVLERLRKIWTKT